jgi:hypothetical protein
MTISQILMEQNYLRSQDAVYIKKGLATGTPVSSIFSEIYLQYMENTKISEVLLKHHIQRYFHYVHDILIVYKEDKTCTMFGFKNILQLQIGQ